MRIVYGIQTKRARRVERNLETLIRVESQELDIDHDTLTRLVAMHREAQRVVARFEERDIEAAIEDEVADA